MSNDKYLFHKKPLILDNEVLHELSEPEVQQERRPDCSMNRNQQVLVCGLFKVTPKM